MTRSAFVSVAFLASASTACGQAAGEEIWFQLYSSPRLTPLTEMRERIRSGPFPDVVVCYAVGALALDALNQARPDRDYMGRCGDGDLLTLRQMTDRAIALLPKKGRRQ